MIFYGFSLCFFHFIFFVHLVQCEAESIIVKTVAESIIVKPFAESLQGMKSILGGDRTKSIATEILKKSNLEVSFESIEKEMPSLFVEYKKRMCPKLFLARRALMKRSVTSIRSYESTCPSLKGGTDAFRNKLNGGRVDRLCKYYAFSSVLMWDPRNEVLFRDKASNYPRDQYTCEHMVELDSIERGFRAELRSLYASLETTFPKLAQSLCTSYSTFLQTHLENIANGEPNLQFVSNEMEKPKGAFQYGFYHDTFPALDKNRIIKHFNQYDPRYYGLENIVHPVPLPIADTPTLLSHNPLLSSIDPFPLVHSISNDDIISLHPINLVSIPDQTEPTIKTILNPSAPINIVSQKKRSGVKRTAEDLYLSSPSSSPPTFKFKGSDSRESISFSVPVSPDPKKELLSPSSPISPTPKDLDRYFSERRKPFSRKLVDFPVSPNGHFKAARAYLSQDPTRLPGFSENHLSIKEAHQVIGRNLQMVFESFANSFTCLDCSELGQEERKTLGSIKKRIFQIGNDGNVFLNGGIASDGSVHISRVDGMKNTLQLVEDFLKEMGRKGRHVTHETRIATFVVC